MSCSVARRCGLDPALLWSWYRLAAVAVIRPLAWELPYTVGAALKQTKKKTHTQKDNITALVANFSLVY